MDIYSKVPEMNLTINKEHFMKLLSFKERYETVQSIDLAQYQSKHYLGNHDNDCRFCGTDRKAGSFKHNAHVAPVSIGNKFLLSHYECDACNELFKVYDDALSKCLGLYRTISGIPGRKKFPKFKDIANQVEATYENRKLEVLVSPDTNLEDTIMSQSLSLTVSNQPSIPFHRFLALVKIAIAIMPESDLSFFQKTMLLLLGKETVLNDSKSTQFICCFDFLPLPYIVDKPRLLLYKRRNDKLLAPGHILHVQVKQISMQIFLPFSEYDSHLFGKSLKIEELFYPIVIANEFEKSYGSSKRTILKWNSLEKSLENEMTVTMKFDDFTKLSKD